MSRKENSSTKIESLPLSELTVSPLNVRKHVGDLTDLQNSIGSMGLLQPIIVRPSKVGLEVVVGQRRFLACTSSDPFFAFLKFFKFLTEYLMKSSGAL